MGIQYQFNTKTWQTAVPNSWVFISLPLHLSSEIRANFEHEEEGWGRLKATAKIGQTEWKTAIWFDTKLGTYLLPIRANIRKKERIGLGQELQVAIWV